MTNSVILSSHLVENSAEIPPVLLRYPVVVPECLFHTVSAAGVKRQQTDRLSAILGMPAATSCNNAEGSQFTDTHTHTHLHTNEWKKDSLPAALMLSEHQVLQGLL